MGKIVKLFITILPNIVLNLGYYPNEVNKIDNTKEVIKYASNYQPSKPYNPDSGFNTTYGMYCLAESGASFNKFFTGIEVNFDRSIRTIRLWVPYLVYTKEAERIFRPYSHNEYTGRTTYSAVRYDTWSYAYNDQPHITSLSYLKVKGYLGDNYVRDLSFTVTPNSASTNSKWYLQDLCIFADSFKGVNNIRISIENVRYTSSMALNTVTETRTVGDHQEVITSVSYNHIVTSSVMYEVPITDQACLFCDYFLNNIKCSGRGDESDCTMIMEKWNSMRGYFNLLSPYSQNKIRNANAASNPTLIEALVRYDYIVFYKQYPVNDFLNRGASPNRHYFNKAPNHKINEEDMVNLVITISSIFIALSSTCLIIALLKRRNQSSTKEIK